MGMTSLRIHGISKFVPTPQSSPYLPPSYPHRRLRTQQQLILSKEVLKLFRRERSPAPSLSPPKHICWDLEAQSNHHLQD